MASAADDPKKKRPRKNRFSHLFGKTKTDHPYTAEQFDTLSALYSRDLSLRELLYHKAPMVIIKRQAALVNETKEQAKALRLNTNDVITFARQHWLKFLDSDMDGRLRERCSFLQEYAKLEQSDPETQPPCKGPCLGLFCPKMKKDLRKKK
jgi:hypothetical protein